MLNLGESNEGFSQLGVPSSPLKKLVLLVIKHVTEKLILGRMSTRPAKVMSPEVSRSSESDKVKKVGRFAVSPPLGVDSILPRRSPRLNRPTLDSPTNPKRMIMEVCLRSFIIHVIHSKNYRTLGEMINVILERNSKLEEENTRLNAELRTLLSRLGDSSVPSCPESNGEGRSSDARIPSSDNS